jgi:hypothetical protein
MERNAASATEISVPAAHATWRYGRLTAWAVGSALGVVAIHLAAAPWGARLGSYRSGILTVAVFLLASAYSLRKRGMWISVRMMRLAMRMPTAIAHRLLHADRLESWRLFHVIAGVAVLLPLWWHIEQGGGMSRLEAALGACTALLMLMGLVGAVIQDLLPHSMRIRPAQEVRPEDVDGAIHELYVEAEEGILGHSEALVRAYLDTIRPVLLGSRPALGLLWATLTGADPSAPVAARLAAGGAAIPDEAETWGRLVDVARRKVRLEHNHFNLALGVGWMRIHIALAVVVGVLIAFHVAGVLYFSGL